MTVMVIAAVCPKCSEIRARSVFTFNRGEPVKAPLKAEDFEPVGHQPKPIDGEPVICVDCGTTLSLRPLPAETANGQLAPRPVVSPPDEQSVAGVTTLFAAAAGEEMKEMRNIGPDRLLVITNRRILIVDLNRLVEDLS